MPLRKYKPTSPGRRNMTTADLSEITRSKPEKSLLAPLKKTGGRNFQGRTTSRFRGGGHKRRYRRIDFKRDKTDVPAQVLGIEYDPNRTARIALLEYADGERRYILAPEGLAVGQTLLSGDEVEPKVGNCMRLGRVPLGMFVHNAEILPGRGAQMVRSAGSSAQVSAREGDYVHLTMPSGEVRRVLRTCRATIGRLGNAEHQNVRIGKAGRSRWLGRRPHQRGTSQNHVSHPMGGGEGRRGGGRHPCGPTGVLSKGGKTRNRRKPSNRLIVKKRERRR